MNIEGRVIVTEIKKQARELVEILLNGDTKKLNKGHFFSFSIAKFILLKEKILIKNGPRKFYFDKVKNAKYIPMIMKFKNEIIKNAEYTINQIEIESNEHLDDSLKEALWFFNKVRDSLAHKKYSIDIDNNVINIDNVGESYSLKCSIPIELLNSITFIIEKISLCKEDKINYQDYMNSYDKYISKMANLYNFDKKDIFKNNNIYKYDNIYNNTYNNYINDTSVIYDNKNSYDIKNTAEIELLLRKIDDTNLHNLVAKLLYNPGVSSEQLSYVVKMLKQIERLKKSNKEEEDINNVTLSLIEEISNILGIRNNDASVALYNYMCLTFLELEDQEDNYAYMMLNKNDYPMLFNKDRDEFYNSKINMIKKLCCKFNENIKVQIDSYNNHPSDRFKQSLSMLYAEFYESIIDLFGQKNKIIVRSLRNSIEHGNYSLLKGGNILIYDKSNQKEDETTSFIYVSSVNDALKLTKNIDDNNKQNYTFEKFIKDIKNVLADEKLSRILETNLIELSKIIFGENFNLNYSVQKMYVELLTERLKILGHNER